MNDDAFVLSLSVEVDVGIVILGTKFYLVTGFKEKHYLMLLARYDTVWQLAS